MSGVDAAVGRPVIGKFASGRALQYDGGRLKMGSLPPLPSRYHLPLLGAIFALALCVVSAIFGSRGWVDWQNLEAQQESLEALAFRLDRENEKIREHLNRLASDDAYVERLARERLGWVKPGEMVYRVTGKSGSPALEPRRP